jgi:hypothetical protein
MTQNGHLHEIPKKYIFVSWDWTLGVKMSQAYPSFSCSKFTTHCTPGGCLFYCHLFWWMGLRYMPQEWCCCWHQYQVVLWADVPHCWQWDSLLTQWLVVGWDDFASLVLLDLKGLEEVNKYSLHASSSLLVVKLISVERMNQRFNLHLLSSYCLQSFQASIAAAFWVD